MTRLTAIAALVALPVLAGCDDTIAPEHAVCVSFAAAGPLSETAVCNKLYGNQAMFTCPAWDKTFEDVMK